MYGLSLAVDYRLIFFFLITPLPDCQYPRLALPALL
jgi:hypothetical protein